MPHHLRQTTHNSFNESTGTDNIERSTEHETAENIGEWNHGREPGRGTYPMNSPGAGQQGMGVPGAFGDGEEPPNDAVDTAKGDQVTEEFGHQHTADEYAHGGRKAA